MSKRLVLTLGSIVSAIAACIVMFMVKYDVVRTEERLYRLNGDIIADQKEIHILKAEIAHLSEPSRLKQLVKKYTSLQEIKPYQIIKVGDINVKSPKIKKASYNGGSSRQ